MKTISLSNVLSRIQEAMPYLLLFFASFAFLMPVMSHASITSPDFVFHIETALSLEEGKGSTFVSHILFHRVFLLFKQALPDAANEDIAFATILCFMLPLPLIILWLLKNASGGSLPSLLLACVSFGLTIAAPITIWTINLWMIGYVNPTIYHSPTLNTLRLFVIPVSLLAHRAFCDTPYQNRRHRLAMLSLCACLIALSALAKPAYLLPLLPACCVVAAWRFFRRQHIDWMHLIIGVLAPCLLILGYQYLSVYVNLGDGSSVAFGFLILMNYYIPQSFVLPLLLLSLAFPLAVYVLFFHQARRNSYLNLSWIVFGAGAFPLYFVYESGARIYDGNFIWSSYVCVFVLMFASMLFLVKQIALEHVGIHPGTRPSSGCQFGTTRPYSSLECMCIMESLMLSDLCTHLDDAEAMWPAVQLRIT